MKKRFKTAVINALARFVHFFEGWDYKDVTYVDVDMKMIEQEIDFHFDDGWLFMDIQEIGTSVNLIFQKRSYKWYNLIKQLKQ